MAKNGHKDVSWSSIRCPWSLVSVLARTFQIVSSRNPVNEPAPTPLSTRLTPLVAAKIILVGDVPIRTILYAVLMVGVSDRLTHTRSFCAYESAVVVRAFLIGCTVILIVVGCAGTRSETSKKERGSSPQATQPEEEARCEGTRTIKVRTLPFSKQGVVFTTYDLAGCPKGGLLSGTDKPDKLAGRDSDDEIRGLGAKDALIGGLGNDVIYGGPGSDSLDDWPLARGNDEVGVVGSRDQLREAAAKAGGADVSYGGDGNDELESDKGEDVLYGGDGNDFLVDGVTDSEHDKLYCGAGKDHYYADKNDYVSSSCEKKIVGGGAA